MDANERIKILVSCHKECVLPDDPLYLPIQVGKTLAKKDLGFLGDNEDLLGKKDNISFLNPIYCEMSAMYWAWKNIKDYYPNIEYLGLCHYRRYFNVSHSGLKDKIILGGKVIRQIGRLVSGNCHEPIIYEPIDRLRGFSVDFYSESRKLEKIIKQNEMVFTKPIKLLTCDVRSFFEVIGRTYITLLEEIIEKSFAGYSASFKKILNGNELVSANMIILKTSLIDEYCGFVFSVLELHRQEVARRKICETPEKEGVYARVSGYLAELLTATYVEKRKKEIKSISVRKYFIE